NALSKEGIMAEVFNARFLKPIDIQTVSTVCKRIPKILVVEDNVRQGGFGSAILEALNDAGIADSVRIKRLGIADKFLEHGSREVLLDDCGLSSEKIVYCARNFCKETLSV
ncbi:MAG: transketolase C-terminal domain-containing protein, partial [Candidatus Omnitrophota bacterium]